MTLAKKLSEKGDETCPRDYRAREREMTNAKIDGQHVVEQKYICGTFFTSVWLIIYHYKYLECVLYIF